MFKSVSSQKVDQTYGSDPILPLLLVYVFAHLRMSLFPATISFLHELRRQDILLLTVKHFGVP